MKDIFRILAIETSCDETAAAVVEFDVKSMAVKPLSSVVFSQIDIHKKYGGVFPELASREHIKKIEHVVTEVINLALVESIKYKVESKNPHVLPSTLNLLLSGIDAIAVTVGPGLIGSLIVGVEYARGLAAALDKPVIPINHLEGHIFASYASSSSNLKSQISKLLITEPKFPALALIVSGGHTLLVLMRGHLDYKIVGTTLDDATGECFDKIARMLGLPYPGGPALSKLAEKGDAKAFDFPRSMINSGDFNFSFSGLKTAVFYKLRDLGLVDRNADPTSPTSNVIAPKGTLRVENVYGQSNLISGDDLGIFGHLSGARADVAASAQQAIVDVLVKKTFAAAEKYKVKSILVGGGVSANKLLRDTFTSVIASAHDDNQEARQSHPNIFLSPLDLTGDNALSIAIAACYRYQNGDTISWKNLEANASLKLTNNS